MALAPHQAVWLEGLLGALPAEEPLATCSDCAMLCGAESDPRGLGTFDPAIKCCTYLPELHNFLVGGALEDQDPGGAEGRATLEARIDAGVAVTPLGLGRPRAYDVLYRSQAAGDFGRTGSFRCPHYLADGRCGVWRHRESTCATWFCKHERGKAGADAWRSIHRLLGAAERALARHCLLELDLGPEALELCLTAPQAPGLDGVHEPAAQRALWGRWAGRERAFYRACHGLAREVSWERLLSLGGVELQGLARLAVAAQARLSAPLPERLRPGCWQVAEAGPRTTRVITYSPIDPLELPTLLLEVLHLFAGRSVPEALEAIRTARGVRLTPALVQRLVDFRLLVPAAAPEEQPSLPISSAPPL